MKTHPTDDNCLIFQLYRSTSDRPPHLVQVLALPPNNHMPWLKKREESFERTLESIRDRLDLWKMGAAFDTQLRCNNSRLINAFAKSLLHIS